jgi:NAD(P)-dependent dehydrogenase (short-subunit alcohol dehydrogenase family)
VIFDSVSYTVTKHAAIGLAEWLAATYIDQGIGVSVLYPAAVRTPILAGKFDTPEGRGAITTDELAEIVIQGLTHEHFMISTHPWVLEKFAVKAHDYDEYIATMRAGRAAELTKTTGA